MDDSLLTNHADEASDFLNWKELPQNAHDRTKAGKDKLIVQTSASPTGFQKDITVEIVNGKVEQKEWNFILFPPASEKIHMSRSGFKLNLQPCPKEQEKTWATQFLQMEEEDV